MKCEVYCCPNRRKKTLGKSFFRFPRDKETADLWLKEIGREGVPINDNRFVCEDHFEDTFIFQWKDRKVIDKEATPFHDYRACMTCFNSDKNENIHPGPYKRKKSEQQAEVKSNPSALKSNNVIKPPQVFIKEEFENTELLYGNIRTEDVILDEMDWSQEGCTSTVYADERFEEFCENKQEKLKEVITFLEVDPLKYEIEETPVEDMCNKDTTTTNVADTKCETVEIIDSDDENLPDKTYEEHNNVVGKEQSSPNKTANSVGYIQGSCRVCLTNCFNGQSIFKYYKKKFLPNIILILTGIHVTKGDELPSMICFSCANLLLQAESIRCMCLSSYKFLKQQKEFKIKMESFDTDDSQHKLNLAKQSIEYPSMNLGKDKATKSIQKEEMPGISHIQNDVIKEETQFDDAEIKIYKSNEKVLQDEDHCEEGGMEKIAEGHLNVEMLDDDIEDQHCDEERLEEENEDQHQDKETLEDVNENQFSYQKPENETLKSSSYSDNFNDYDDYNDFDGNVFEIFKCSMCLKEFDDKKLFDRHQRTHIETKIKCPFCPKAVGKRSMKVHLATHKEIDKLICDQCGDVFNNVFVLFKHLKQHKTNVREEAKYIYSCDLCEDQNVSLLTHQNHMRSTHGLEDPRPFKCKQCQIGFTRKQGMYRHIENVHKRKDKDRVKDFLCNICGKNFYVKFHLDIHMRSHTGERPHKCKYCEKAFTQLSALRTHEYIHTGEKPFACKHCGKKFKQYGHLTYHQQTHAEGFPYDCKICDRKFKIKSNLGVHMKLHNEKQFSCKICQKEYVWPCKLKDHFRRSHPGVEISEVEDNLDLLEES